MFNSRKFTVRYLPQGQSAPRGAIAFGGSGCLTIALAFGVVVAALLNFVR